MGGESTFYVLRDADVEQVPFGVACPVERSFLASAPSGLPLGEEMRRHKGLDLL